MCVSEHRAVAKEGCHLFVFGLERTIRCQGPAQRSGEERHVAEGIKTAKGGISLFCFVAFSGRATVS